MLLKSLGQLLTKVIFVFLILSNLWFLTESTWGHPAHHEEFPTQSQQERFIHDPDFPVRGTTNQQADAIQQEGKEEALKSLQTQDELTVIPVPVVAYTRNEDAYYGVILAVLKPNSKGQLEDIIAPQYLHNQHIGEAFTMNYYGYPSDTTQYNIVLTYATKVFREMDLSYKNVGAGGGRYILAGHVSLFKNPFRRFFGIGSHTQEKDETSYTSNELLVDLTAGINLAQDIALMWSERFRQVQMENGIFDSLPQTQEEFPAIQGVNGANIWGHKITFRYDTRDQQLVSTHGSYLNVSIEWNQDFKQSSKTNWWRTSLDARHFFPHFDNRLVFVSHLYADTVDGGTPPFYERPTLGGENSLRGFGGSRFIDDTALVMNMEERMFIRRQEIFGYHLDLELAPFIDIGRVGSHFSTNVFLNPQVNPGIGIRFLARPYVVGRVDIAFGKDNANVFAGLNYPF
ncbi:MAG: BamA/TamA family outer membrane protein [Nitrospira sp.]|nr:BamA/TamA family outer membrane protein [Nitrospira sp.]